MRAAANAPMAGSGGASSATKRIQRELKEISESPSRYWTAAPANDDLFEWHFAVRGPPGTDFEGGIYTGRVALPVNYPLAPPSITLLTPNGRWEIGKKICLSNSSYHPELWQPAWGIRTMMEALRAHFPAPGDGAIGALDWPSDIRKRLAKESLDFVCTVRGVKNRELLPELSAEELKEESPEPVPPELRADVIASAAGSSPDVATAPEGAEASMGTSAAPASGAPRDQTSVVDAASAAAGSVAAGGPPPALSQTSAVLTAAASSSAAVDGTAVTPGGARRRRDNTGTQRRRTQASVIKQLFRPPETRRQALLLTIDVLIFLVIISFIYILVDLVRNPPGTPGEAAELPQ